ncbi:hypothetical protein QBC35DRAFT_201232 [Podospora australis]|uniref:Uncharacterized protein n=1 Tax=Podospora australis TaxID=1536484 RepID=A0AAN6X345_9PEZI|nr:hypothetical protein QBC35DRAFT_201232 [Podospora australis]
MESKLPFSLVKDNTEQVFAEVASYDRLPVEKIVELWRIYTTTWRKMVDPNAYRQENFWWHVLGSDMKFWSGARLAKLYREVATSIAVAPLCEQASSQGKPGVVVSSFDQDFSKTLRLLELTRSSNNLGRNEKKFSMLLNPSNLQMKIAWCLTSSLHR